MSDQWYVKTKNGKRGPYSKQQLQHYIDAGAIRPNAGLGDGDGNWVAAVAVEGLTFPAEVLAQLRAAIQARKAKSAIAAVVNASATGDADVAAVADATLAPPEDQNPPTTDGLAEDSEPAEDSELAGGNSQAIFEFQQRSHLLDERERQLQTLQEQLNFRGDELETLAQSLQQREAAIVESERVASDRESEIATREKELNEQSDQLDQRESELRAQREQLESQQVDLDQRLSDFQQQSSAEHELKAAEDETARQRISELEEELSDSRQTLQAVRDELAAKTVEVDEREVQLQSTEEQIRTREQALELRSNELDDLTEQLSAREQAIRQSEAALEEHGNLLAEREVEIGNRHNEVMNWQRELESIRSVADSADLKTKQAEESISQLKQTIADQESELSSIRVELNQKSQQLDEFQSGAVRDDVDPRVQTTVAAIAPVNVSVDLPADVPAELILSEKKKLLREFAARQESLSQREAELMRREAELTRRELDIIVTADSDQDAEVDNELEPTLDDEADVIQRIDEEPVDEEPVDEESPSEVSPRPLRAASSWEEALGRSREDAQAYELADLDDPRFGPSIDEQSQDADAEDQFFDDVLGTVAGGPTDSGRGLHGAVESRPAGSTQVQLDIVPKDRLPSEMLPSELPEYDAWLDDEPTAVIETESAETYAVSDAIEREVEPPEVVDRNDNDFDAMTDLSRHDFRRLEYEQRFGPSSRYDVDQDETMRVDVSVHQPSGTRDFATLVTSGMSDYPIPMPNGQRSVRAELLLYATHIDELAIEVLRSAAKIPYRKKHGLSIGTTGSLSDLSNQLSESHQQDCVYMLPVIESDSKPIPAKETLGSAIQLFWLVTITDAERKLIETSGIHKFLSLLEKNNHAVFFDLTRECYVKRKGWFRR
ncbi:MAG: suppressor of fused domain protein [Planctomycetales bacterium]|nr:suppressor of fused domain protein [Planctomycetales bacterium]